MSTLQVLDMQRLKRQQFVIFTMVAGVVAALAAWGSAALQLAPWVMFAGWIAWFTRPTSLQDSLSAMVCLWLGMVLAGWAHMATAALAQPLGTLALPTVVFLVAVIVVGLRTTVVVDNMLGWFLGMVTFFAAEVEPALEGFVYLGAATAIGGAAGWACQAINRRWAGA